MFTRKKLTRVMSFALMVLTLALVLVAAGPGKVNAASYPSIIANEFDQEACVGTYLGLVYSYFPAYKNEKIIVKVYDEDGDLVAKSEKSTYNTVVKMIEYTSNWDTTDYEPGRYKVQVTMEYYSFMEWRTSPRTSTRYVTLKEHNYTASATTAATVKAAGAVTYTCATCGDSYEEAIPKIAKVALSEKQYVYDRKAKKPTVTVTDSEGNELVNGTDYKVKYASGRKKVGSYAVTVTFKGKYSGTKKLSFTIKPKDVAISSVKTAANQLTVKWKKGASDLTGYQVVYATNSKFTKNKVVKLVKKAATTSLKATKLKGNSEYFVRVRAYKTVDGKTYYSDWSETTTVFVYEKNSPKLSVEKKTLTSGSKFTIKLKTVKGKEISASKLKFSSNKKSVATVNSKGVITAKKPGVATISVKYKGVTYKATITVKSRITLATTAVTLEKGDTQTVKMTIDKSIHTIYYNIEDTSIVSCKWNGWSGRETSLTITPKAVGTTRVKIYHKETGASYDAQYIDVTVLPDWTVVCNQKFPLKVGQYSSYDGEAYTEGELITMDISQDESYSSGIIVLNMTGVLNYRADGWSNELNFSYRVYDEDGFIVESGHIFTDADLVGAKFKYTDKIYIDDPAGDYTIEFYDYT